MQLRLALLLEGDDDEGDKDVDEEEGEDDEEDDVEDGHLGAEKSSWSDILKSGSHGVLQHPGEKSSETRVLRIKILKDLNDQK